MEIAKITPEQYEAFGKDKENWNFLNSLEQYAKLVNAGKNVELIGGMEDKELKAAAMVSYTPVARKYKMAYIPRGFLVDWKDEKAVGSFSAALKNYWKKKNVMYAYMNPYLSMQPRDMNGQKIEGMQGNEATAALLEKNGWLYDPAKPGYNEAYDALWMSVLDLKGKTADVLLKKMDQQTRWSINRSKKYNLELKYASGMEEVEEFAKMMEHTGLRNGFHADSAQYYKNTLDSFKDKADLLLCYMNTDSFIEAQNKIIEESKKEMEAVDRKLEETPNSKKFVKRKKVLQEAIDLASQKIEEGKELENKHGKKILLAGSLFLRTDKELVYLYSGAYDEFMKYNAPYAIHMAEIEKAIELGMERYNFYGISGNFEKGEDGYSLFDFKRGFGCTVVELMGNLYLPVKPVEFSLYNKMKHIV